jgi:Outer membrane lipoprotein-sorting protein
MRLQTNPARLTKAPQTSPDTAEILFMQARKQIAWSVLIFLASTVACASAQTESSVPTENIIAHMAQAGESNHAHFRPYVVTVDYKIFGKETAVPTSQVIAELTFVPPYLKSYAIRHANGTHIGETIVRRMLEGQMAFAKDAGSTDISQDNYDFRFIREEDVNGHHCYVLELLPRRKAKNLLHGNIWVDANTYLLHRVEGEPVKSSSWWLRDVRIVLLFGYVGQMWMQTSSESTADVRIVGQYKMISQDVSYEIDQPSPVRSLAEASFFPGAESESAIP